MKDTDLLLTLLERVDVTARACRIPGVRVDVVDRDMALCRAQVRKVLAVLAQHFSDAQIMRPDGYGDYVDQHIDSIAASLGLTWPLEEG